ncbi:MAG: hypothetical protein MUE52_08835 [Tabrizicola sp.]|jgi:hypothetical protein|nr:hypothetical protein [Tabrizicola sp.]
MNVLNWLVRAKRWAQNPPSEGQVKLVFGVVAICLALAGYEYLFGWPEWLTPDRLSAKP